MRYHAQKCYLFVLWAVTLIFLAGCHENIRTLNYGARVPDGVHSLSQIHRAIAAALDNNGWHILQAKPNFFQASKQEKNQKAVINIAYGYEGYDIEYASDENMQYDPDRNTISRRYTYWESKLARAINDNFESLRR